MHPRKTRAKMSIQGNVYPMTSAAIVENDRTRVSLLTAQSHGVASLVTGLNIYYCLNLHSKKC